jgi:anti-sigma-K factor RskA
LKNGCERKQKEMNQRSEILIEKYNAGTLSASELHEVEQLIARGEIDMELLEDLTRMNDRLLKMEAPSPGITLDEKFVDMLAKEKKTLSARFSWQHLFSSHDLVPKLAFASVTLILGFIAGLYLQSPQENSEVKMLTKEVSSLKEMMMLSLLEKTSATERLKAVSLTTEMHEVSSTVTKTLLQTLNNDENVNVRLAALEALIPYVKEDYVREELIRSIVKQESPLVQLALAELMVSIQEKSSVTELQKILRNERTPYDIKRKIKESIDVLT